jgi:hypothetical protein
VDGDDNLHVTGVTGSDDFPLSPNARDTLLNLNGELGPVDAFATKLNPSATGDGQLLFSTYLGGAGNDTGTDVAVDADNNMHVTGVTDSDDFPTSASAFDDLLNINGSGPATDVFVTKLNPSAGAGTPHALSTYLGGGADESCHDKPAVTRVDPIRGAIGDTVTISGTGLGAASAAAFGASAPSSVSVVSDTQITAVVPDDATTGRVVVVTPRGSARSASDFTVIPRVSLDVPDDVATEGGADTGRFRITRTGSAGTPLTVNLTRTGTATSGSDFAPITVPVTIPAGSPSVDIQVIPVDDTTAEPSETVVLQLQPSTAYAVPAGNPVRTVTIRDNELPVVFVTVASARACETPCGDGRVVVNRIGSLTPLLTVNISMGGTAQNGSDYRTPAGTPVGTTVALAAGSPATPIVLTAVNDAIDEDPETAILTLVTGPGYSVRATEAAGTVTIEDNDPLPSMTVNSPQIPEGALPPKTTTFTVSLNGPSGKTVTVNFATEDGTAVGTPFFGQSCMPGRDYLPQSGTLTFAPGAVSRGIVVPVCPDSAAENNESFKVRLTAVQNARFVRRQDAIGTATILNDDGATGSFEVTPVDAAVGPRERIAYAFTWTVPPPRNWHDLKSLEFRIRKGPSHILWLRFDEASNTLAVFDKESGTFGKGAVPGKPGQLATPWAILHLAQSSVVGSGPTGPSVTLNLSVSLKRAAPEETYIVEVAARDDEGNRDGFQRAGTLTLVRNP